MLSDQDIEYICRALRYSNDFIKLSTSEMNLEAYMDRVRLIEAINKHAKKTIKVKRYSYKGEKQWKK